MSDRSQCLCGRVLAPKAPPPAPSRGATDGFSTGGRLPLPCLHLTESMMGARADKANANCRVAQQHQRRPLLCEILRSDKQIPRVPPNHLPALCLSELFRVQAIQRGIIFRQKSASKSAANRIPSITHTFFFHFTLADW